MRQGKDYQYAELKKRKRNLMDELDEIRSEIEAVEKDLKENDPWLLKMGRYLAGERKTPPSV